MRSCAEDGKIKLSKRCSDMNGAERKRKKKLEEKSSSDRYDEVGPLRMNGAEEVQRPLPQRSLSCVDLEL